MMLDDGRSTTIDRDSADPQHVIATAVAEALGWAQIRPEHLRAASVAVARLTSQDLLADLLAPSGVSGLWPSPSRIGADQQPRRPEPGE